MACISRALIVGGGVAGLSAAIALSRQGVHCEVVELHGKPDGASMALSGRAAEALFELGVYEQSCVTGRIFAADSTAAALYAADGQLLRPSPRRPEWPGSKDGVAVFRPAFAQILEDTASSLCTLRKGVTITAIDDSGDSAQVTFSDGETRAFDLVIGADGIHSLTRKLVFPEIGEPEYSGQISIRWMVPGPAIEGEGWYTSDVGKVGFYYLPHQQLTYVPAVLTVPERRWMSSADVYGLFTRLLDSISAKPIKQLQERLKPVSQLIGRPFNWILVPGQWHRGRTLLIGDAAHATTAHLGMGAGMALEDAVVLSQCIASEASLPQALEAFMRRRFERVKTVVESSVKLSQLEQRKAPPSENGAVMMGALTAISQPY
ncbi:FAD-dependent monooxygenase [Pseudomonas sp. NPDC087336]|uniref:FAD-dependent monooxygenase n=1 Tax=Pseudomonas sp. NPDC087336 TaxID=3364436 RepID=UPI00381490DD